MQRITTTLVLALVAVFLVPSFGFSERGIQIKENRTALVIGNGAYKNSPLRNPTNDAHDMSATLRRLEFKVTHLENANQRSMEDAIRRFGRQLRKGGVGLFYFAGHGVQVNGRNYLIPIGAEIEKETDVKYEAVDAGRVLDEMYEARNGLNVVILDACRDNPYARSFRTTTRGLSRMDAPTGTFIAYATAPGSVAADGPSRNGVFTESLLRHMAIPDLKIEDVLKEVRKEVIRMTDRKQVPWQSSSLTGDFYFNPERAIALVKAPTAEPKHPNRDKGLDRERESLERERQEVEQLKMEIERKKLQAERKRLEAEKKKLEVAKLPPKPMIKEIARDGYFIAYANGVVKDTSTGLMWASRDNGKDINWRDAKRYCENYRGGGYSDWRMPTLYELEGLYDRSRSYQSKQRSYNVHLTELIQLTTCCPWASEIHGPETASFDFLGGYRHWRGQSYSNTYRALPVRAGN
jgi:hypothetical protein